MGDAVDRAIEGFRGIICVSLTAMLAPASNANAMLRKRLVVLRHLKNFPSTNPLPESPNEEEEDDQPQRPKRSILLQQQLPIDPHRRSLVLRRVLPQS